MAVHRAHGNRSCNSKARLTLFFLFSKNILFHVTLCMPWNFNALKFDSSGCHNISSCFCLEGSTSCRCSLMQRMKKGWKRRDYLQQRARQERLNYSRKWRADDHSDNMIVKMAEEDDSCISTLLDEGQSELQINGEEKLMDHPAVDEVSQTVDGVGSVTSGDIHLFHPDCDENGKIRLNKSYGDESSCVTECTSSNKENYYENASVSSPQNELTAPDDNSSAVTIKFIVKSKRHCDRDLDNPKPRKFRRPVDDSSFLSCKYSTESFCSINDHLPDGFYDAGRNRPFMSLKKYEQSLCIDSREVILLDR